MKLIGTKLKIAALGCLMASMVVASAGQIKCQIDTTDVLNMGWFHPENGDLVQVSGGVNNWGRNVCSNDVSSATPNIYSCLLPTTLTNGQWQYFDIVFKLGGVEYSTWSSLWFQITNDVVSTTYPFVYKNYWSSYYTNGLVTFSVDMSIQRQMGLFVPSTDTVAVRGDFNDSVYDPSWQPPVLMRYLYPSPTNADVYTATYDVHSRATTAGYSFLISFKGGTSYDSVTTRKVNMTNFPVTLPTVYFSDLTNTVSPVAVTFQANMGMLINKGAFDPSADTIKIAGSFNGWGGRPELYLTNVASSPNLFMGTVNVFAAPGSVQSFSYFAKNQWENGYWVNNYLGGFPASTNRNFIIPTNTPAITLPWTYCGIQNLGTIKCGAVSNNQVTITWPFTAFGGISLQSADSLTGASWQDVPDTLDTGMGTIDTSSGPKFFRLIGPQ